MRNKQGHARKPRESSSHLCIQKFGVDRIRDRDRERRGEREKLEGEKEKRGGIFCLGKKKTKELLLQRTKPPVQRDPSSSSKFWGGKGDPEFRLLLRRCKRCTTECVGVLVGKGPEGLRLSRCPKGPGWTFL